MHPALIALILGIPAAFLIIAAVLMIRRAFRPDGARINGLTNSKGQIISHYVWLFCGCLFGGIGALLTIYAMFNPEVKMLRASIPLLAFGYASFHASWVYRKHDRQRRA